MGKSILSPINGLSVRENVCRLLACNLTRSKIGSGPYPRTDLELAQEMDRLYPGRGTQGYTNWPALRRYFQNYPKHCPAPYTPLMLATLPYLPFSRSPLNSTVPRAHRPRFRITPFPKNGRASNPHLFRETWAVPATIDDEPVPLLDREWYLSRSLPLPVVHSRYIIPLKKENIAPSPPSGA